MLVAVRVSGFTCVRCLAVSMALTARPWNNNNLHFILPPETLGFGGAHWLLAVQLESLVYIYRAENLAVACRCAQQRCGCLCACRLSQTARRRQQTHSLRARLCQFASGQSHMLRLRVALEGLKGSGCRMCRTSRMFDVVHGKLSILMPYSRICTAPAMVNGITQPASHRGAWSCYTTQQWDV